MTKILAIDDQKVNLTDLRYKIRIIFPEVELLEALSGKEGIDLALNENPDVILLDIMMPGMDGYEICKRLKASNRTKDIPVIFLTVVDYNRENRIKALNAGAEAFLKRPADDIELKVQITTMLKIRKANIRKKLEKKRLERLVEKRTRELQDELTKRKNAETELILAKQKAEENDHLKSVFLANMSHEIRTPMNGILGFTALLKDSNLTGEERNNYLNIIEKSGERLLNTINDLIDISKIESNQMEVIISEININDLMDYLFSFFDLEAAKKGLKLSYSKSFEYDKAFIRCDKDKLNAVLMNLLKNAIKYTNTGNIKFGYVEKNEFIEFFVKDTGIGIAGDRQKTVFDRFVQADISTTRPYEGAGLGLAIAKAYVVLMGGEIWFSSEAGKGSQFYFNVPYRAADSRIKVSEGTDNKSKSDNIWNKLAVLVVEDDEVGRIYFNHLLSDKCKRVIYAKNGKEAIELFRKNPETDLILMDIKMPEMDGYSATSEIKKMSSKVLVVAQSAYAFPGDKEKALEAGCDGYLTKPLMKEKLLETIQSLFKKKSPQILQ